MVDELMKLGCLFSSFRFCHTSQRCNFPSVGTETTIFVPRGFITLPSMGFSTTDNVVTCRNDGYECTAIAFSIDTAGQSVVFWGGESVLAFGPLFTSVALIAFSVPLLAVGVVGAVADPCVVKNSLQ